MNIRTGKKILEKYPNFKTIISKIYNLFSRNYKKIKGKNNQIFIKNSFIKNCNITIYGENNKIIFGDMCYLINTKISIYGNNNIIKLGERVYVNSGDFYLEDSNNQLEIGEHTTFSGQTHLALTEGKKITIGKKCLFSSNIIFRTGDSHSILNLEGNRINFGKDISIGNHVWLTQNVTVLKGAKISGSSIIATGSIVTKEFEEENVLIAGNPAKVIKTKVDWCNERI